LVVGASGNDSSSRVAYPAKAGYAVSVGATTSDLCLADYSNGGVGLDLVAPGGGTDANLSGDVHCHPFSGHDSDILQMTFDQSNPARFSLLGGYEGTSMAAPHVAATAALVVASGVIGRHPSPDKLLARLKATARDL